MRWRRGRKLMEVHWISSVRGTEIDDDDEDDDD